MRKSNTANNLELYAVSGTNTVILSMDMKQKPAVLHGFAFERVETKTKKRIWLYGQKFFNSVIPIQKKDLYLVKGQKYPTFLHPVQSFLWKDFTVEPGIEYTYIVTALGGTPKDLEKFETEEITIRAEKNNVGKHGIFFNRGVSGSQSYAEQFGNERPDKIADVVKRNLAYRWLSRGLYEGLLDFIADVKPGEKIRGACYEFHYDGIIDALMVAKSNSVDVEIVYDAINYGDENKKALEESNAESLVTAVRDKEVSQAHNKFFVHIDVNDVAVRVWTGSTNISIKGIFGQCNTGHIVNDSDIASRYYEYWKLVKQNLDRKSYRTAVMTLPKGEDKVAKQITKGINVFFSPRSTTDMLQAYADLIEGAAEMVCCIYPFNIDQRFQTVFKKDVPFIRYILLDKRQGFNTFTTDDKDVEVTAGAYIKDPVDQWTVESSAGKLMYTGVDFVHNKIILIDPLSSSPTVITGSANYSENSTWKNDENTLVIKGHIRCADIYFTEYVRLFDHFSFREWLNSNKEVFNPYLDETSKWVGKYFDNPEALNVKRKLILKNMFIP